MLTGNKIISMLTESESSASSRTEKEKATSEKIKLLGYMEQEKTLETLVKNKGLPETFIVISDTGVNVTVNTKSWISRWSPGYVRSSCAIQAVKQAR